MQRFPAASQVVEYLQTEGRFSASLRLLTLKVREPWTLMGLIKLLLLTSLAQLRGVKAYPCKKSRNGRLP